MNKLKWLTGAIDKRGGLLLTTAGLAFDISCAVTTGKACVRANRIIEAKMEEYGRPLTSQEKVELTWKLFLLPVGLGAAGAGCHIGTNIWHTSQNKKKEAALMTIAAGTETAYTRLKEEIPEVVGTNKASKIEEAESQRAARENLVGEEAIERIKRQEKYGPREILVFDKFQGRWFYTNTEELKHAQNVINELQMQSVKDTEHVKGKDSVSEAIPLNEWNLELGLEPSTLGEICVWTYEFDGLMDIGWYGSNEPFVLSDGTEIPYLILVYTPEPRMGYTE